MGRKVVCRLLVEDKNIRSLLDDIQSVVEARNLPPRELIAGADNGVVRRHAGSVQVFRSTITGPRRKGGLTRSQNCIP